MRTSNRKVILLNPGALSSRPITVAANVKSQSGPKILACLANMAFSVQFILSTTPSVWK